jgi:hypothetical protein
MNPRLTSRERRFFVATTFPHPAKRRSALCPHAPAASASQFYGRIDNWANFSALRHQQAFHRQDDRVQLQPRQNSSKPTHRRHPSTHKLMNFYGSVFNDFRAARFSPRNDRPRSPFLSPKGSGATALVNAQGRRIAIILDASVLRCFPPSALPRIGNMPRYSLRTLIVVMLVAPPIIAAFWSRPAAVILGIWSVIASLSIVELRNCWRRVEKTRNQQ